MDQPSAKEEKNVFALPNDPKKIMLIIGLCVFIALLVVAGAIFYFVRDKLAYRTNEHRSTPVRTPTKQVETVQPAEKPIDKAPIVPTPPPVVIPPAATDPVGKLPDANPLNKNPNPFKDAYHNPFE